MADAAVENKEVPVVEKEVEEVPEIVKEKGEKNGASEEPVAKENGDSDKPDAEDVVAADEGDETSNGDSKEETNGDSTDAPAEAVKRKVAADVTEVAEEASPEKKAKLSEDAKEVETNGADATEVAA